MVLNRFKKYSKNIVSLDIVLTCQPNQIAEIPIFMNAHALQKQSPSISGRTNKSSTFADQSYSKTKSLKGMSPLGALNSQSTQKNLFFTESLICWHMLLQRGKLYTPSTFDNLSLKSVAQAKLVHQKERARSPRKNTHFSSEKKKIKSRDGLSQQKQSSSNSKGLSKKFTFASCRVTMRNESMCRSLEKWHTFALPIQKQNFSLLFQDGAIENQKSRMESDFTWTFLLKKSNLVQEKASTSRPFSYNEMLTKRERGKISNIYFCSAFGYASPKMKNMFTFLKIKGSVSKDALLKSKAFLPLQKSGNFFPKYFLKSFTNEGWGSHPSLMHHPVFGEKMACENKVLASALPKKFTTLLQLQALQKQDLVKITNPKGCKVSTSTFQTHYSNVLRSPEIQEIAQSGSITLQGSLSLQVNISKKVACGA